MSFLQVILINLAVALAMMLLMWLLSVAKNDASVVDPFWGFGFVVLGWTTIGLVGVSATGWLLVILVTIWGLRLSGYLLWRNRGKGEDRRYAAMREKHGDRFWWFSLFSVFLLQGLIMWFVSLTVQAGIFLSGADTLWSVAAIGLIIWSIGIVFEAGGDFQMARFKADPDNRGKVMDRGFWRYTRHPNYFGDFCVWWGLFAISAATGAWWTVFCPVVMSLLLLKVSGVTLLESDIEDRRPKYAQYKRQTNAFFPGPVKD